MNERSRELFDQGRLAMDAGRYAEAAALLDESWRGEVHFKTFELLGECHLKMGRARDGIPFLSAATTLNRGVRAPALLVLALLEVDEIMCAGEVIELVKQRDPNHSLAKQAVTAYMNRTSPSW